MSAADCEPSQEQRRRVTIAAAIPTQEFETMPTPSEIIEILYVGFVEGHPLTTRSGAAGR